MALRLPASPPEFFLTLEQRAMLRLSVSCIDEARVRPCISSSLRSGGKCRSPLFLYATELLVITLDVAFLLLTAERFRFSGQFYIRLPCVVVEVDKHFLLV